MTDSVYNDHIPKSVNGLILYNTLKQEFMNGAQFVKGIPLYKTSTTTLNAPQPNAAKVKVNYAPPPTDCEFFS